jgi:ferritin-like metal-binding protein YciE
LRNELKEATVPADSLQDQLVKYLTDVHSTEQNALSMLRAGAQSVDDAELAAAFREHLAETEEHARLIKQRLEAHNAGPSKLKDVAQKGVATVTGAVANAAPDTAGKMAIQGYAFEHLEIASYRMLRQVAERAGDQETVRVADRILVQERAAADKLSDLLERVADHDLAQMGLAA